MLPDDEARKNTSNNLFISPCYPFHLIIEHEVEIVFVKHVNMHNLTFGEGCS